ncbi:MAG TPA: MBL fold metallo-hydrolase [Bryobacteraceae bacterium]|nr:MBL fold metallo-hydrolase [Bryobacteraceae bacterium]
MPDRMLFLALMLLCCCSIGAVAQPVMRAHFLPVGQAHATLLEFSCGAALIDAGAQDAESVARLLSYLDDFFSRRPDLQRTLDLVLITHNHIDHTRALREIADRPASLRINVRNYVDSGQVSGVGTEDPLWIRANARTGGRDIRVREVTFAEIAGLPHTTGLTDDAIDPINCSGVDPVVRVLSGRHRQRPSGWTADAFANKNNHSIVTRVDFGSASFLFTGDLEAQGIARLLSHYAGSASLLDVDVYQVGHHGSHNATTLALLNALSPKIAVIPMGNWDFGKGASTLFHTHAYGHPRKDILDLLGSAVTGDRNEAIIVMAAVAGRKFAPYNVRKAIYATGWDGVVTVQAAADGSLTVTRH